MTIARRSRRTTTKHIKRSQWAKAYCVHQMIRRQVRIAHGHRQAGVTQDLLQGEHSTQEYLAIKQDLAEPDPLRLTWRDLIKTTIREVVTHPDIDPLSCIQNSVAQHVSDGEQPEVQALIVEELRRLHEGVLARYGLRPSEFMSWKSRHGY